MDQLQGNIISAKPVVQNKQDFLIGVFPIKSLLKFTKFTGRIVVAWEDGKPIYNKQIQRFVEKPRVEKIADFLINDPNATFPTNIVLHIPEEVILKKEANDEREGVSIHLEQAVFEEIAKKDGDVYITIIDGQHRIRGIEVAIGRLNLIISDLIKTLKKSAGNEELKEKLRYSQERLKDLKSINLVVTFFLAKTLEYQAMIFSTINRTQKRVSPDLVFSLFGLDKRATPQKTALQVALSLNGHEKSPFYKRIRMYGGGYSKDQSPPLSQAAFVRSIIDLICESTRESENDRFRLRKKLFERSSGSNKFLPFRKFYAGEKDNLISDTLYYYFSAIRKVFTDGDVKLWELTEEATKPTNILHTTVGYMALLSILIDILREDNSIVEQADVSSIFRRYINKASEINVSDITRYSFNNRGKKILYLDMSLAIWPIDMAKNPDDARKQELEGLMKKD